MTVTNDRRREVARNLREHGLFASLLPLDKYLAWMYDVINCGRSVTSLTIRLADLIEPEPERTCRVVTDKNAVSQTQEVHTKYCSECSYVFGREQHRPLLPGLDEEFVLHAVQIPDYCPNCGAKVTDVGQ